MRAGQYVAPGDVFLSIASDDATLTVVALLPGEKRPFLRQGIVGRMEVVGHVHDREELTLTSIGDRVVGKGEVARILGHEVADTVTVDGSVVVVEARAPQLVRSIDGRPVVLHEGMHASLEVPIGKERTIFVLVPPLKELFR